MGPWSGFRVSCCVLGMEPAASAFICLAGDRPYSALTHREDNDTLPVCGQDEELRYS